MVTVTRVTRAVGVTRMLTALTVLVLTVLVLTVLVLTVLVLTVLVSGAPGRVVVVVRHVSSPSLKRQRVHQVQRPTRPEPGRAGPRIGRAGG